MAVRLAGLTLAFLLLAESQTLRVMSFNVRYPAKGDGANVWDARKDLLVDAIRKSDPDVMGTQELFYEQGEYIVAKLPDYAWFGVSRRGNREDEHMGVFYRKDRLEVVFSGNFWLSTTPEEPGSMSWDMSLPRMVTWGEFRDKRNGRRFFLFNTHFPHRPEDANARVECARVLAGRIAKLSADTDVILTGDFNTGDGSEPYKLLTKGLRDTWREVQKPVGPEGTFHGFSGTPGKDRIDWILFRGKFTPASMEVILDNREGRYPSDHFPVAASFVWAK